MSTLNSSQLHVKRSSTRLHAPPGGHSSLSFGLGGFGTTDPPEKNGKADPSDPPPISGSYRGGGTSHGSYNYPSNNQTNDGFRHSTPPGCQATSRSPFQSQPGSYHRVAQPCGVGGITPQGPSGLISSSGSLGPPLNNGRPPSTQSNLSWGECGSQPPLTGSKRDQNWEKKRRLWLARKNGSFQCPMAQTSASNSLPPPPTAVFRSGERSGGGYFDHLTSHNPPSPLTKFIAQQNHGSPFSAQETSGAFISPPGSSCGVGNNVLPSSMEQVSRMGTAMPGGCRDDQPHGYSSTARHLTSSAGYSHHGGYGTYAAIPPSPGVGLYNQQQSTQVPSTASLSTCSTRRQPPGGSTSWNPYS